VTTGSNLDPDGYEVMLDGLRSQVVAVQGTVTFADVEEGNHGVELTGLAANCTAGGANPRTVTVTAAVTTTTTFDVTCAPAALVGQIVWTRFTSGIYSMNTDGSNPTLLPVFGSHPAVSPDGTRLSIEKDFPTDLYTVSPDGADEVQLTTDPAADRQADWSPDGSQIVFVSDRDGNDEIYVMNADGTGQTRLTNDPQIDEKPAWSPDGARIAFERQGEILLMNADGSGVVNLTETVAESTEAPAWSPDGTRIAFVWVNVQPDIYTMNTDGSGVTQVTDNPATDWEPAWSPDGQKIAFTSDRDGNHEIYTINVDGTGETRLTDDPLNDFGANWSP